MTTFQLVAALNMWLEFLDVGGCPACATIWPPHFHSGPRISGLLFSPGRRKQKDVWLVPRGKSRYSGGEKKTRFSVRKDQMVPFHHDGLV